MTYSLSMCQLCELYLRLVIFFFFKQKTAYEMRISDWSSDVCSSDLLSGPVTATSGRHPLPEPAAFAQRLAAWGIDDDTQVVAYDQGNGLFASRLWWLLRASGHRRVAVLDGGLAAWSALGLPMVDTPARVPAVQDVPVREFTGWLDTDAISGALAAQRSEETTSELQSPIRIT